MPKYLSLLLGTLLLLTTASSASAFEVRATAADNGETAHLNRGDVLQVSLSENPGTGFAWRLTKRPGSCVLRLGSNRFIAPRPTNPPTTGAPGRRVIRWRAIGSGHTSLRLGLVGPGSNTPTRTYRLPSVVH